MKSSSWFLIPFMLVDLQYDERSFIFTAGVLCCVCSRPRSICEVVLVPYVDAGNCDVCNVVCIACVYAERVRG